MIINIICGAPETKLDKCLLSDSTMYNIGVDRGAIYLLNLGVVPDYAIGDFDSISEDEFVWLNQMCSHVSVLQPIKDETDTEMAIRYAMTLSVDEIRLYGAMGGRMDHTFANLKLLASLHETGISACLCDQTNSIRLLSPGHYVFDKNSHHYLSFFAFNGDVEDLSLVGVKYPLNEFHLLFNDIRCTSNEVIADKFEVSFNKGLLLMINSSD
ncbi:MAG: thiamine diphosphokinase [Turicibacter sp.]